VISCSVQLPHQAEGSQKARNASRSIEVGGGNRPARMFELHTTLLEAKKAVTGSCVLVNLTSDELRARHITFDFGERVGRGDQGARSRSG
jgi:hypothetical protein